MIYRLDKKTGFKSSAPIIAVYTEDYEPFYIFKNKGREVFFNLPSGNYVIDIAVTKLNKPISYKKPKLPKYERNIKRPKSIDIYFTNNPNKCSIDLEKGIILCDHAIKLKSRAEQLFIMLHELAHYHYKTEAFCDLEASANMLELGYNPSQLYFSINGCLSDRSEDRKDIIYNFAKNIKR